jgi:hypothetical protein
MSLANGTINPLNVLGIRKINFMPDTFHKIQMPENYITTEFLEHWIEYNLNSRYSITRITVLDTYGLCEKVVVGFEDEKDLTVFCISYPNFLKG